MIDSINYVAVALAAVLNMVLGMIWYSEAFFGKSWMKAVGITKAKQKAAKGSMPASMVLGLVSSITTALVVALLLAMMQPATFGAGYVLMFWVWLGFNATMALSVVIWEMKPARLFFINGFYQLASVMMMATVVMSMA